MFSLALITGCDLTPGPLHRVARGASRKFTIVYSLGLINYCLSFLTPAFVFIASSLCHSLVLLYQLGAGVCIDTASCYAKFLILYVSNGLYEAGDFVLLMFFPNSVGEHKELLRYSFQCK